MMANVVYILCGLTSFLCAAMLYRGYRTSRARFLLWSSLCFVFLTLGNILLAVDLVVLPTTVDLSIWRTIPTFIGLMILLYGMIWDAT